MFEHYLYVVRILLKSLLIVSSGQKKQFLNLASRIIIIIPSPVFLAVSRIMPHCKQAAQSVPQCRFSTPISSLLARIGDLAVHKHFSAQPGPVGNSWPQTLDFQAVLSLPRP